MTSVQSSEALTTPAPATVQIETDMGEARKKLREVVEGLTEFEHVKALAKSTGASIAKSGEHSAVPKSSSALKKIAEALALLPRDPVAERVTLLIDTADALEAMGLSEDAAVALVDKLDDLTEAMSHLSLDRMARELAEDDYNARWKRLKELISEADTAEQTQAQ